LEFYTSKQFEQVVRAWGPFLAGRDLFLERHILVHDLPQLEQALASDTIEVAMTRVKPGKVADYYAAFMGTVHGVLSNDPGCNGFFINSTLENPTWQVDHYLTWF
jgi:hypothetical protein